MAAAGAPDHVIQKMSRWKSLAFLMYIQFRINAMQNAMKLIVNKHTFSSADTLILHPGARRQGH
jgi:hypothetical protein